VTPRLVDRIALSVALLSLLVIGVRPASTRSVDSGAVVVRTPGATMAEARAVAESIGARVVDLEAGERPADAARLHLVGWGLDAGELRRWGDRDLVLHWRGGPPGISKASWPGSISLGEEVVVRLTIEGATHSVALIGEDGVTDSLSLGRHRAREIALRHFPKAAGNARYILRTESSADTFSVLVTPPRLPAALLLASAPAREWSDLRDWLTRQGAQVTLRMSVARGRDRTERINTPARAEAPLSGRALAGTGVVITDTRTLAALPRSERLVLESAVTQGLGLVVMLGDETRRTSDPLVPWRLTPVADLTERQVRPRADGRPISPTPVSAGGSVLGTGPFGSRTLLDDGQGGVLAMAASAGRGRIVGTVVNGAGRWLRGGEDEAFASYWHTLVDAAAREPEVEQSWELPDGPVIVDQETHLARSGPVAARWVAAGDTLMSAIDPLFPTRRTAIWWPRVAGWNDLDGIQLYVGGPASWSSWQGAERTRATQRAIARRRGEAMPGDRVPVRVPWPLLPFYILFVGAAAVLWRRLR
jgi:hypothetical protein